jgi:SAM-dependent methyltransferase
MDHLDRRRAEGFGALADRYERTRPSYPAELIAWLTLDGAGRAVDVGCGTGRVAVLLAAAGWKVLGLEPDARMAAIARAHGFEVAVTTLEQWQPPAGGFDLVAAGTAWHWIDPALGYERAASALRSGGKLAIFRNAYRYDDKIAAIIERNLSRHAPHLLADCVPLGIAPPDWLGSYAEELERRGGLFGGLARRVFRQERAPALTEWIEELTTHSPIMVLGDAAAEKLLSGLAADVESETGGRVPIVHETHCLLAGRR